MQKAFTAIVRVTLAVAAITLFASTLNLPLSLTPPAHAQIKPTEGGDGENCGSCCPMSPCGLCSCGVCTGSGACSH